MAKYKVGDKVRIKTSYPFAYPGKDKWSGKIMTIKSFHDGINGGYYTMMEDAHEGLAGTGWAWGECMIDGLVSRHDNTKKLIVTTDGETTTAKLIDGKQTIKTATAKCSKDDEFCFETGAQIAVDRLLGKKPAGSEKPKFTKADLKNGMFGFNDDPTKDGWREWFVVVDDLLVYEDGCFDWLSDVHEDLSLGLFGLGLGRRISFIVDGAKSFACAKDAWKTHDNKFGTILYERK